MRRRITIRGIVQGVGFRPFVYNLARKHDLVGFVNNRTGDVLIEIEGEQAQLDQFQDQLRTEAPPLSLIESLQHEDIETRGDDSFQIEESTGGQDALVFLSPDVATCDDCLRELFDVNDRRYLYPFLNCAHCGPRLTIIQSAPYDRARTSMSSFAMCETCQAEYDDPSDRRFHAQPVACPVCGPRLCFHPENGDAMEAAITALRQGKILAVKGLGGYHLCCDARDEEVVSRLRHRKQREEKPFAVMLQNLQQAQEHCVISPVEEQMLRTPRRPIVLLRKKPGSNLAESVAPRNQFLGVMLPYTPLHHVLMYQLQGMPIVMTSGNLTDEPIAFEDEEAMRRLESIADGFLSHNRPIYLRCDDSVSRSLAGEEVVLRRARGFAPAPLRLPVSLAQPTLALGGQMKSTFALGRESTAILSHHLGDLDYFQAFQAYEKSIEHYQALFNIHPEILVHDLHPDYASTRYAFERESSYRLIGAQHHHAHLASCMAEHGLQGEVLGVILDGTGYGTDHTIWGGELLLGDYRTFKRALSLRPVLMPGGEKAVHEPWRMALSYLLEAGQSLEILASRVSASALKVVSQALEKKINTPQTSSMGRLFDAVAALCGVRDSVSFEGQAAMELEQVAADAEPDRAYSFSISDQIDTRPMIRDILNDVQAGERISVIARRFHSTIVAMMVAACEQIRDRHNVQRVALSGGCFMNALLAEELSEKLGKADFEVYRQRRVPPNDGGLSLGQLAIAGSILEQERGSGQP